MVNTKVHTNSIIDIDEATNSVINTNKEVVFETLRNEINYFFNHQAGECIQNKVNEFILKNQKQILESVHKEINQLQHTILSNIRNKINNTDITNDIIHKKNFIQKLFS